MDTESTNYQCPSCGGALRYSATEGRLLCEYCDSSFTVSEVEAIYAARLDRTGARDAKACPRTDPPSDAIAAGTTHAVGADDVTCSLAHDDTAHMRAYTCSSCAAELVCDVTTAITECPYCGNQAVIPGVLVDEFKPDLVIPFKLDKAAAIAALSAYYKGKKFLPRAFASNNRIEKIQGVYVPFWLYDAEVVASAKFEATRTRTYRTEDEEVTETDHYDVYRAGSMSFSHVPVDGSSKMPDAHMDAIEPFDYDGLVPFSMAYLPGFAADRFDLGQEECRGRAERRIASTMEEVLRDTVTGYDSVCTESCDAEASWQDPEYALMPVWMLSTTWNGKGFLFAMNGQTGRLIGDLPIAAGKVIAWFAGIFVVTFSVMAAATSGLGLFSDDRTMRLAAQFGLPALVAFLICLMFYSEMKTAKEAAQANAFMRRETFDLTAKSDVFTSTSVTRRKVERSDK